MGQFYLAHSKMPGTTLGLRRSLLMSSLLFLIKSIFMIFQGSDSMADSDSVSNDLLGGDWFECRIRFTC